MRDLRSLKQKRAEVLTQHLKVLTELTVLLEERVQELENERDGREIRLTIR